MIYESVPAGEPIRQGDILGPVPVPIADLGELHLMMEEGVMRASWDEVGFQDHMVLVLPVESLLGIVATQDCDTLRTPFLSLFVVGSFRSVTKLSLPTKPKKWVSLITKQSREGASWFYLPPDDKIGFGDRMAIDFDRVFQVQREFVEQHALRLRKGRLNEEAYQHFRECVAQYYRRYPYNEWYPLNKEEFQAYDADKGPVSPYDWQKIE